MKEFELVDSLLHYTTKEKVAESFTKQFVMKYSEEILADLQSLLLEDRLDSIRSIQKLFSYTSWAVEHFNLKYSESLKAVLAEKMGDMKAVEMVAMMLDWIQRLISSFIGESSAATHRFRNNTHSSFRAFIASNRLEKNIAKFMDHQAKKVSTMTEEEYSDFFAKVQLSLDLVQEKSLFELHYKHYLKGRLLSFDNYDHLHYETKLLDVLKPHLDYEQVEHMELALLDVKHSMSLQTQYENFLLTSDILKTTFPNASLPQIETDFKIVSFTFWDVSADYKPNLQLFPPEANLVQGLYTKFYKDRFKGRNLIWLYNVGSATLTMQSKRGKKELTMSKIQAFICFLFNSRLRVTLEELKTLSQLPEADLLPEIAGLVFSDVLEVEGKPKKAVLQRQALAASDKLMLTQSPEKLARQGKVKQVKASKESAQTAEADAEQVFGDYKRVTLESMIMKTLKSDKRLKFEELASRVSTMAINRFTFTKKELLEVLEKLVNNEYIHRDPRDLSVFNYSDLNTTGSSDKSRRQLSPKAAPRFD